MKLEELEKLEQVAGKGGFAEMAAKILSTDGQLSRKIIEDWLGTMLPLWEMFHGELSTALSEGHLAGPSPAQAEILKRMRDKGHRIAPVRGFFRWIGGNDQRISRVTMMMMIERGWLRMTESQVMGLEYFIIPTREGMIALANYSMDKEGRAYP